MPGFDPQEMVARFRARAEAVRTRPMPPIEGPERQRFREQAQRDFADFAMIGDAEAELVDGILTLRIDLRPPEQSGGRQPELNLPGCQGSTSGRLLDLDRSSQPP